MIPEEKKKRKKNPHRKEYATIIVFVRDECDCVMVCGVLSRLRLSGFLFIVMNEVYRFVKVNLVSQIVYFCFCFVHAFNFCAICCGGP